MNEAAFEAELARIKAISVHSAPQPLPAALEPPAAMSVAAQAHPVAPRAPAAPILGSGAFLDDMADFQVEVAVPKPSWTLKSKRRQFDMPTVMPEGAEAGLLELLAEGGRREDDADTWLTLFDLYRATGARGKSDDMALQFAARFGRSASSLAAICRCRQRRLRRPWLRLVAFSGSVQSIWECSRLPQCGLLARSPQPWRLDWRKLNAIELSALPILDDLFKQWASEQVQLRFLGGDQLLQVLAEQSLADDRSADPQWWSARLNFCSA